MIASLGYFYNSNHHTLSAFLGEAMMSQPALAHWREVIQATVMRTVCVVAPDSSAPAAPGGAKAARARSARKA